MKKLLSSLLSIFLLNPVPAFAHEGHHDMNAPGMEMPMSGSTSANAPMQRDGSGTSWLPDTSPVHAFHFMTGDWAFMLHGSIFGRYNWQNPFNTGKRGGNKFDAPNWFMAMAQTPLFTNDRLTFRGMFSLDPLTIGGSGYPLLFQTGESWQGKPLIDAQHPHDLFSELSVTYSHVLSNKSNIFAYLGFPGEPALGPTAFMHRPSSYSNPDAPIAHHWQDATHITFGVGTLGWIFEDWKVDASIFTGREPDENRYNFDLPKFDSYSTRITYNPLSDLSLQTSFGYIKSPEALTPDENVLKASASIAHNKLFNPEIENYTNLATTLVWGMNAPYSVGIGQPLHSVLLESELQFIRNNFFYTKMEYIQKDDHELVLNLNNDRVFNIFAWTLGASRNIVNYSNLSLSAGVQASLYFPQSDLENFYGKYPLAFEVFLRLAPDIMNMPRHHDMKKMDHDDMEEMPMEHMDHM
jgi:hypothetical protein